MITYVELKLKVQEKLKRAQKTKLKIFSRKNVVDEKRKELMK